MVCNLARLVSNTIVQIMILRLKMVPPWRSLVFLGLNFGSPGHNSWKSQVVLWLYHHSAHSIVFSFVLIFKNIIGKEANCDNKWILLLCQQCYCFRFYHSTFKPVCFLCDLSCFLLVMCQNLSSITFIKKIG